MGGAGASGETVTLWRPTGQAELDLAAAARWRAWPPRLAGQPIFYPVLSRWYATKITREWNVPRGGVGYVTRFEVRRKFLDRYPVQQTGGRDVLEYWIPADDLAEFNANMTGPITEVARYLGPVHDQEFTQAAAALRYPLPASWRDYLQGQSWFSRGWLPSGCYLFLLAPGESLDAAKTWAPSASFPGLVILGTDGSRELLAADSRRAPPPVVLLDITSTSWHDALPKPTPWRNSSKRSRTAPSTSAGNRTGPFTRASLRAIGIGERTSTDMARARGRGTSRRRTRRLWQSGSVSAF